jgi:hypothetical protein
MGGLIAANSRTGSEKRSERIRYFYVELLIRSDESYERTCFSSLDQGTS